MNEWTKLYIPLHCHIQHHWYHWYKPQSSVHHHHTALFWGQNAETNISPQSNLPHKHTQDCTITFYIMRKLWLKLKWVINTFLLQHSQGAPQLCVPPWCSCAMVVHLQIAPYLKNDSLEFKTLKKKGTQAIILDKK